MKFDDFDIKMRKYEESLDQFIPQEDFMVARLDGKGFTKLTKEDLPLKRPFDAHFKDALVNTMCWLMQADFQILYAYNESDEISLLFNKNADIFNRKVRKFNSILAGEVSVKFSQEIGTRAVFDCRMIPLPDVEAVEDYFLWRQEDSHRNSINAHCYYALLNKGFTPNKAAAELSKKTIKEKLSFLNSCGIKFKNRPVWEVYGTGVSWQKVEKVGFNPVTKKKETALRRRPRILRSIPTGEEYRKFIRDLLV